MPRKTISEPVYDPKRNRWKVDIPATLSHTGERQRSFHKTRNAAREYISKVQPEDDSDAPAIIPPALAHEADKARNILEKWNLDLVQAARIIDTSMALLESSGSSIKRACESYADRYSKATASKPLGDAVNAYLNAHQNLRDKTLEGYRYTLETLISPLHAKVLATVTSEDLEKMMEGKALSSKDFHRRNLRAFWRWCSIAPRKWTDLVAIDDLEKVKINKESDVVVLSPEAAKSLLKAALDESKDAAIPFAIALFASVRSAELNRLKWGHIFDNHIEISANVAKKSARRFITISPSLRKWLNLARKKHDNETPIVPPNWTEVSKSVRRRAGWDVVARRLEEDVDPHRGPWPTNVLRHTSASMLVANGTPLETLLFEFGHSGKSQETLIRHYVRRMTKKDAQSIMLLTPSRVKA